MLDVRVLGQLQVTVNGNLIEVAAPMQRALLAALAMARGHVMTRDQLIDALWADPPTTAVNAVQQHVSALRAGLGRETIVTVGGSYRLKVESDSVDVDRFHALVAEARRRREKGDLVAASGLLGDAIRLWCGAVLADMPDCPFVAPARAALDDALLAAELLLVSVEVDLGHAAAVTERAGALASEHPFNEAAAEQLMRALAGSGRTADALDVYERFRARLVQELGVDPGEQLRATQAAVLTADPGLVPASTGRWLPDTVPRPIDALLGRQRELTDVEQLLANPGVALVTLSGPGGVGKTRLAVEVALRGATVREVVYVPLDVVPTPDRVMPTLAAALQLRVSPDADLVTEIVAVVQGRDLLVVLDNLEHVIGAAPDLARLLSGARGGVQLLVTSREALRIRGEHLVRVNPLATVVADADDAGGGVDPVSGGRAAPAVELFWQRAEAASPEFRRAEDPEAVRAICEQLDGLPLAIELAAARINVLEPARMVERLSHRLDLLTTGTRDSPHRQQSLRACLEWSVDLLTDDERRLLAASSVFIGGATLASLEAVAAEVLLELDCIAVADSLVAKSLLRPATDRAGTRLFLLETVRELAAELLAASGKDRVVKLAHAHHFHDLLAAEPNAFLWPPRNAQELAAWSAELPNARAALHTLEEAGATQLAADLAVALLSTASNGGFLDELDAHLTALQAATDVSPATQIDLRGAGAWVAEMRDETIRAGHLLDEALAMAAAAVEPDPAQETMLHLYGSVVAYHRGDSSRRAQESQKARSASLASGNEELIALVETIQPMTATAAGFLARAERTLATARRHENQIVEYYALLELSEVALNSDDPFVLARAEEWGRRASQIGLLMGDVVPQARGLGNAGAAVLLAGGPLGQAAADLRASLQGAGRVGDASTQIEDLVRLAAVEGARGATERAALLFTAWRALEKNGPNVSPSNQRIIDTFLHDLARRSLDADDPAARLSLAEAVEVALAERTFPAPSDTGSHLR